MNTHFLKLARILGVCILCVAVGVVNSPVAKAQTTTAQDQTPEEFVNQLYSADKDQLRRAFEGLAKYDKGLDRLVLGVLRQLKKEPDRRFGGSFETTLRVVSVMNIRDALRELDDIVDFQLDPTTMPVGGFGGPLSYYPVARTVIELNDGRKTTDIVLRRFDTRADEDTIRVYTYVLQQVLGQKVARFVVQDSLEQARKKQEALPNAPIVQIAVFNLEQSLKYLDEGKEIIREPASKVQ